MASAATASDHHQPSAVSSARLASVTPARAAPARLRMPSPRRAVLWSGPASRSFARARTGSIRTEAAVSARPTGERSGGGMASERGDRGRADVDPDQDQNRADRPCGSSLDTGEVMLGRALTVESPDKHRRCAAVGDRVSTERDERDRSCREPGDDRADAGDRGPANGQAAPQNRLGDLGIAPRHRQHVRPCRDQPRALRGQSASCEPCTTSPATTGSRHG